ncbi:MAG: RIP metalloprotease RseP, partial [Sphingobacteriaceae bacterium]
MNVLIMIGQLIAGLSILVILHEAGHFFAARAFGIKVEKFYLFFDAWNISLFKFNYKGVEYGIGWLPLGGYVKIAGMIDESMDTDQMSGPPQPWEFRSKPAWQRLIVMLAGVTVNIVLGIFIFWMLTIKYGESYIPNQSVKYGIVPGIIGRELGLKAGDRITAVNGKKIVRFEELISSKVLLGNSQLTVNRDNKILNITVPGNIYNEVADYGIGEFIQLRSKFMVDSVVKGSNAQKAGLQKGDSIKAINAQPIVFFDQFQTLIKANKSKQVNLAVKRSNEMVQIPATVTAEGTLGFAAKGDEPVIAKTNFSFLSSLPVGASKAWGSFTDNAKGISRVATGQIKANRAFAGPVTMA